jgi:hypothetical protein
MDHLKDASGMMGVGAGAAALAAAAYYVMSRPTPFAPPLDIDKQTVILEVI